MYIGFWFIQGLDLLVQINFLHLFLYCPKWKLKNLLVQTMFYWSWAGGLVLNVSLRTAAPSELLTQRSLTKIFAYVFYVKPRLKKMII